MNIFDPLVSGSLSVSGSAQISGSLTVLGGINGNLTGTTTTASYVEYNNVDNKPTLISGSSQISGLGYAITGSNTFNGNQIITGSLTVTGSLSVNNTPAMLGTITSGQVAFGTGSGTIGGDSGLTWDNTYKSLGIGTAPATNVRLDVSAQGELSTDIAFRVRNSANTFDIIRATGDGSVFVGLGAGNVNIGDENTANGTYALYSNTEGRQNTANGAYALYYNTEGNGNTANGRQALYFNTTGGFNTANGVSALNSNTTGNQNTADGVTALYSNTTGESNTANGFSALYSNTEGSFNTANGIDALYSNTEGGFNTANGFSALSSNTEGGFNTANGSDAGRLTANGTDNTITNNSVFIGADTRALANNQTNQIVIGHTAIGLGSNTTVLGNSSTTFGRWWGNLLLGNSVNSGQMLQVTGNMKLTGTLTNGTHTYTLPSATGTLALTSQLGVSSQWSTNGTSIFYNGGNVGIGTNDPNAKFQVIDSGSSSPFPFPFQFCSTFSTLGGWTFAINNGISSGLLMGVRSGLPIIGTFGPSSLGLNPDGGNVLIGTTTDNGAKLQVNGVISATGGTSTDWNDKIGGTIASGQVAFGTGSGVIGGDAGLFWDNVNKRLNLSATTFNTLINRAGADQATLFRFFATNDVNPRHELAFGNGGVADYTNSLRITVNFTERWRITSTGILQSNGAQTIQTSGTESLTLQANGGNVLIGGTTNNNSIISINSTNPVISFGTSSLQSNNALVGTSGGANFHIAGSVIGDFCVRPIASGNLLFGTATSVGSISSERMRITTSGNVLIGTTTDNGAKLQVNGNGHFNHNTETILTLNSSIGTSGGLIQFNNLGGGYNIGVSNSSGTSGGLIQTLDAYSLVISTGSARPIVFGTNSNRRMRILSDGNITLNGTVYANTVSTSPRTLYIDSAGGIGGISSVRESKSNINYNTNTNWIYDLKPVSFNYKKKDENGNYIDEFYEDLNYGLIAEDTEVIADFLINYTTNDDGTKKMLGIEYSRLITPLLKAIQELKSEINILKNK